MKIPSLPRYWLLPIVLFISGCGDNVNLTQLCKDNQQICNEFPKDSWCKSQRVAVILGRIKVKNEGLEIEKYNVLVGYEKYIKCMSLAAQIQHIKLKGKTTQRKNNVLKAKANLSLLVEKTASSTHPHLLYYRWSREFDDQALAKLLALEGKAILDNSTAQYHLATYYIKRDTKKTLGLLYRALELHPPGTTINPEILQSLVTIYTKKKQYKQSYIWLRTYQLLLGEDDPKIETSLSNYQQAKSLDANFLDKVASSTLDKIEAGQFTSPTY
ncbi:DUF2989 domain-containing protein [Colwellia piezophila]|uniref:DUF2989 domain-containing protein n=1 Tax=Colwellia piezophila TaxID=211668 RepID=UPI0003734BD8|nr:DUF2989 domain-containing protein [Colwellia piezophila]